MVATVPVGGSGRTVADLEGSQHEDSIYQAITAPRRCVDQRSRGCIVCIVCIVCTVVAIGLYRVLCRSRRATPESGAPVTDVETCAAPPPARTLASKCGPSSWACQWEPPHRNRRRSISQLHAERIVAQQCASLVNCQPCSLGEPARPSHPSPCPPRLAGRACFRGGTRPSGTAAWLCQRTISRTRPACPRRHACSPVHSHASHASHGPGLCEAPVLWLSSTTCR
jgi:hypothetical protein